MSYPIADIDGIGPDDAVALKRVGIRTTDLPVAEAEQALARGDIDFAVGHIVIVSKSLLRRRLVSESRTARASLPRPPIPRPCRPAPQAVPRGAAPTGAGR